MDADIRDISHGDWVSIAKPIIQYYSNAKELMPEGAELMPEGAKCVLSTYNNMDGGNTWRAEIIGHGFPGVLVKIIHGKKVTGTGCSDGAYVWVPEELVAKWPKSGEHKKKLENASAERQAEADRLIRARGAY